MASEALEESPEFSRKLRKVILFAPHSEEYLLVSSGVREALVLAYSQAEDLFDRVERERGEVECWGVEVSLPGIDPATFGLPQVLGSVGEQRLVELVEFYDDADETIWEANLKQMRRKKRELERIPDFVRVDCFMVHLVILKAVVEEQIERYGFGPILNLIVVDLRFSLELVISLKRRVNEEIKSISERLESSLEKLSAVPESFREIAECENEVGKLSEELPSIRKHLDGLSERAVLIESTGGGVVVGLERLRELCGAVTVKVEGLGSIVEDSREKLKQRMGGRIDELEEMAERYASRWKVISRVVGDGNFVCVGVGVETGSSSGRFTVWGECCCGGKTNGRMAK